jgi:hypothetical protein
MRTTIRQQTVLNATLTTRSATHMAAYAWARHRHAARAARSASNQTTPVGLGRIVGRSSLRSLVSSRVDRCDQQWRTYVVPVTTGRKKRPTDTWGWGDGAWRTEEDGLWPAG